MWCELICKLLLFCLGLHEGISIISMEAFQNQIKLNFQFTWNRAIKRTLNSHKKTMKNCQRESSIPYLNLTPVTVLWGIFCNKVKWFLPFLDNKGNNIITLRGNFMVALGFYGSRIELFTFASESCWHMIWIHYYW